MNFELNKDKDKITINMDDLGNHYHSIFNRPLNFSKEIKNRVNDEIVDLDHGKFDAIEINMIEFKYTMKLT